MAQIIAIAQSATAIGLGLTGIQIEEVRNVRQAERCLEGLLASDAKMLLVDEAFRSQFSDYANMLLQRHHGLPLVIFCPRFQEEEMDTESYINALLRPSVGFEIRLD